MELINRYVAEVGRHLPEKSRQDIENELRSLLEDMLEDRARQAGRPADEEMEVALLKEHGAPAKVAASYLPPKYLIGPGLYPTFIMIVKILIPIILVLSAVRLGIAFSQPMQTTAQAFPLVGDILGSVVTGMISALGNLVIVFAILERVLPEGRFREREWDPRSLKPVVVGDRVRPRAIIVNFVFTALFISLILFYPGVFAMHFVGGGQWVNISVLSTAFFSYVPWMIALMLLRVGLNVWLLRQGSRQPLTRWLAIGLRVLSIALLVVMLTGPSLVSLDTNALLQVPGADLNGQTVVLMSTGVEASLRLALTIVLIVFIVNLGRNLYRVIRKQVDSL